MTLSLLVAQILAVSVGAALGALARSHLLGSLACAGLGFWLVRMMLD